MLLTTTWIVKESIGTALAFSIGFSVTSTMHEVVIHLTTLDIKEDKEEHTKKFCKSRERKE